MAEELIHLGYNYIYVLPRTISANRKSYMGNLIAL